MSELPALVQALLTSRAYPEKPRQIKLAQTQMSFVFLIGDYVYKVKKPVDFGFLDYTTLEKRRFYCHQELVLNRRLCPDVYLDVVKIVQDRDHIRIGGKGKVIEYAVKMRQLPGDQMMDQLILRGQLSREMVERVAKKLVEFHRKAETNEEIASYGALDMVRKNIEENLTQTEKYIGISLSREKYESLKEYANGFMAKNASLFHKRTKEGKIRDCHGDLHAAHVCFSNGLYIFDCIEFNERFRYCDVASEIAFLAMDLDYHGQGNLSKCFTNAYIDMAQDQEILELLPFYKCYRAYVRGKVESFKLDDPNISAEEKTRVLDAARRYFELAGSYV